MWYQSGVRMWKRLLRQRGSQTSLQLSDMLSFTSSFSQAKQTCPTTKQTGLPSWQTRGTAPTNRTLLMVTSLLSSVPSLSGDASLPFWKSFDPRNCLGIMRLQTIFHFLSTPWGKAKHRALTHWRPGEEASFHYPSYCIRNL